MTPPPKRHPTASPWDPVQIRAAFPALLAAPERAYLDHAATSPRLASAVSAAMRLEQSLLGSPGRGVHTGIAHAQTALDAARAKVATVLHTPPAQVIFTTGTTAALNQAAHGLAPRLQPGDQILVTPLDHHANLLPWRAVARQSGAEVVPVALTEDLRIDLSALAVALQGPVRILALPHVSNVVGRRLDLRAVCGLARKAGVISVVDGAQGISGLRSGPSTLGCDLYAFGGHKLGAMAGAGVLWGRSEVLEQLQPWRLGGGMVDSVRFDAVQVGPLPRRLEAGTPPLGAIASLAEALSFHQALPPSAALHLLHLRDRLIDGLRARPWVRLACTAPEVPIVAFGIDGVHPHDVGSILDAEGVAVRVGHHCAAPLHDHLGWSASVRASCGVYTRLEDVDHLLAALDTAHSIFASP